MSESKTPSGWRVVHGTAFALIIAGMLLIAPALGRWPWVWLGPLAAYFVLVALVPPLRRSFGWLRSGRLTLSACAVTLALAGLTSAVLVSFQFIVRPDLRAYKEVLPLAILGGGMVAGATFALLNAVLEELVFRGGSFRCFGVSVVPVRYGAIDRRRFWAGPFARLSARSCRSVFSRPLWRGAGLAARLDRRACLAHHRAHRGGCDHLRSFGRFGGGMKAGARRRDAPPPELLASAII